MLIIAREEMALVLYTNGVKRALIVIITSFVVFVLFGVLFQAPISVWADVHFPNLALFIKAWKEVLIGLTGLLLIALVWIDDKFKVLVKDRILWLVGAIGLLHVILLLLFDNHYVGEVAALLIDLRIYLFFAEVYVILKIYPAARRPILAAFIVGISIVMTFSLLQVTILPKDFLVQFGYSSQTIQPYLTVDLNPNYTRISSTLRGPNPLGALALIVLVLLMVMTPKYIAKLRDEPQQLMLVGLISAGSLVSLWFSYSRSALGAFSVAASLVVAIWLSKKVSIRALVVSILIAFLVTGSGVWFLKDYQAVQNIVFHSNPEGGSDRKSDHGHIESLSEGVEVTINQPMGAGLGSVGSASLLTDRPLIVENQYLYMAHESGWLGLILQIGLFGWLLQIFWRRRQDALSLGMLASGLGLAIIGLVLPVWADDTVGLVWWGLAGAVVSGYNYTHKDLNARTNHKKTKRVA
jgi:hypothetical protein